MRILEISDPKTKPQHRIKKKRYFLGASKEESKEVSERVKGKSDTPREIAKSMIFRISGFKVEQK
jgi:hypothetical protein